MPVTVQTASPVDRAGRPLFHKIAVTGYRSTGTVDPNKQRAKHVRQPACGRPSRSTVQRAHGYVHLSELRSTGPVDRLDLS